MDADGEKRFQFFLSDGENRFPIFLSDDKNRFPESLRDIAGLEAALKEGQNAALDEAKMTPARNLRDQLQEEMRKAAAKESMKRAVRSTDTTELTSAIDQER